MFGATLVLALGIAGQETHSLPIPAEDYRPGVVGFATKYGISYPSKDGPWRYMAAYDCIDPCDNPYAYMAVRYRTFRPDFGFLEFKKVKKKR